MRLSMNQQDPTYEATIAILRIVRANIYLDGVLQTNCTTADEQRGVITRACLNARGKLQTTACGRRVKLERLRGHVIIKLSARK